MMAVDILPSGIPIDASKHFSDALLPYLTTLIEEFSFGGNNARPSSSSSVLASAEKESGNNGNGSEGSHSSLSSALNKATVARGGKLMKDHEWLRELVKPIQRSLPTSPELQSPPTQRSLPTSPELQSPPTSSHFGPRGLNSSPFNKLIKPPKADQGLIKKRVLLLGSGMVAQPVVDYLVCKGGMEVMIG